MTSKRSRSVLVLTCALALLSGCATTPTGPLSVPLLYRPTRSYSGLPQMIHSNVQLSVVDERLRKDAIGQNIENPELIPVLSVDDPASFVRNVFAQQLATRGATVAAAGQSPQRQLTVHLTNFWTEEGTKYRSQVNARVQVLDPAGKQLWEGLVAGEAENFGRSLNVVNYQEAISNATMLMATELLSDPSVVQALNGR